jgi:tight adherence protein C
MLTEFLQTYQSAVLLAVALIVCAIVTGATYAAGKTWRAREDIRRRAMSPVSRPDDFMDDRRSLRHSRIAGASKLLSSVAGHFVPVSNASVSAIRRDLQRAGFFQHSAIAWYYFVRVALAALLPAGVLLADQFFAFDVSASRFMTILLGAAIAGLVGPGMFLSRRIKALEQQCRDGFPDFMDLMVVCAEAGISIDQAIGRVGRELAPAYPYLGVCLHLATLELRAGRPLTDAFNKLAERMGIEEAHNLGSLLQQSEELGTSLSDALRVYSEEMRDKRMSRAEEKAHALPAKMAVPLTMFVFPVILVVILLPVYVRVSLM